MRTMFDDVLLISDERMIEHDPGYGHPERPQRLQAILRELADLNQARWEQPPLVTTEQLARVHSAAYIEHIEAYRDRSGSLDPDTQVSPASVPAAYLAAGAAVRAVEALLTGETRRAFALVRPPGHHAEPETAMGFCLFNNIAVAAAHACAEQDCERVLVVDWDVHHGNGTQEAFYDRSDVLFFSLHQYPFFPGTGRLQQWGTDAAKGYTINVPLPAGCGDADYLGVFDQLLVPIADAFKPQLVLVSAGFDAHRDDPLAQMCLTKKGYQAMTALVRDIADRHAHGRLALVLEGGYDLGVLAQSVRACCEVMSGGEAPVVDSTSQYAAPIIAQVVKQQGAVWPL